MSVIVIKSFRSSLPKLSKILAFNEALYKKMFVIKQFLRKALSLYFDFLLNNLLVLNANAYVVIDFLSNLKSDKKLILFIVKNSSQII